MVHKIYISVILILCVALFYSLSGDDEAVLSNQKAEISEKRVVSPARPTVYVPRNRRQDVQQPQINSGYAPPNFQPGYRNPGTYSVDENYAPANRESRYKFRQPQENNKPKRWTGNYAPVEGLYGQQRQPPSPYTYQTR